MVRGPWSVVRGPWSEERNTFPVVFGQSDYISPIVTLSILDPHSSEKQSPIARMRLIIPLSF